MDKEIVVYLHIGILLSVLKNDITKYVGKWPWMQLKKKILSEVTQIQKDKYGMYLLISGYYLLSNDDQTIIHRPRETR